MGQPSIRTLPLSFLHKFPEADIPERGLSVFECDRAIRAARGYGDLQVMDRKEQEDLGRPGDQGKEDADTHGKQDPVSPGFWGVECETGEKETGKKQVI